MVLWVLGVSAAIVTWCSWSDLVFWPTEYIDGYEQFSEAEFDQALENWDEVMLFFWATRCPPCMALHRDILENQASIPEDVTIFTQDYDAKSTLKIVYDVIAKHTAIYFNADGSIKNVNTAKEHSLEDILEEINK